MIERNDNRVWIQLADGQYYLLAAGITHLQERCKTVLLETPNVTSPLCKQEVLYHTAQLEFEGFRKRSDPAIRYLSNRYLTRGDDALITLVLANRQDVLSENGIEARRITGYVLMENPGSGENILGSYMKGKIVFASEPEKGVFFEDSKTFSPYEQQ